MMTTPLFSLSQIAAQCRDGIAPRVAEICVTLAENERSGEGMCKLREQEERLERDGG